jgi:hypothetical protein
MHDAAATPASTGIRLSYDGRTHVLGNEAGTWEIRLELEQLGAGEIVGVGSVATALDAPHDGLVAEVILSGRVDRQGTARVVLTPLAPGALTTVSLVLRLADGRIDVQDPIVSAVLEVRGLPV